MGSAAFFAPDTATSPRSGRPPFTMILSICSVSPPWLGGHGLCPKYEAIPPLQVLLYPRVVETRDPQEGLHGVALRLANLHCKQPARFEDAAGPLDDLAD